MSPVSIEERKRIRAEQKRRQGLSSGLDTAAASTRAGGSPAQVDHQNKARPSPSPQFPPTKKAKTAPAVNLEIGLPREGGPPADASWRNHLKCQKRTDGNAEAPIRTAWDSWYPVNRVFNGVVGSADPEKVASMGLGQTLVAVKTYSLWASLLAHLAEGALNKTIGEQGQLEGRLKEAEDGLRDCQEKRDLLNQDLQKWDSEKTRLESKVSGLAEDKKKLSTSLESVEVDLKSAREGLKKTREDLKRASALVPETAEAKDLAKKVEKLKIEVATEFDRGFETALAQL